MLIFHVVFRASKKKYATTTITPLQGSAHCILYILGVAQGWFYYAPLGLLTAIVFLKMP